MFTFYRLAWLRSVFSTCHDASSSVSTQCLEGGLPTCRANTYGNNSHILSGRAAFAYYDPLKGILHVLEDTQETGHFDLTRMCKPDIDFLADLCRANLLRQYWNK